MLILNEKELQHEIIKNLADAAEFLQIRIGVLLTGLKEFNQIQDLDDIYKKTTNAINGIKNKHVILTTEFFQLNVVDRVIRELYPNQSYPKLKLDLQSKPWRLQNQIYLQSVEAHAKLCMEESTDCSILVYVELDDLQNIQTWFDEKKEDLDLGSLSVFQCETPPMKKPSDPRFDRS